MFLVAMTVVGKIDCNRLNTGTINSNSYLRDILGDILGKDMYYPLTFVKPIRVSLVYKRNPKAQCYDDEESNHEEASDTGDAPKQQQQVIPQTTAISNIKLPILKLGGVGGEEGLGALYRNLRKGVEEEDARGRERNECPGVGELGDMERVLSRVWRRSREGRKELEEGRLRKGEDEERKVKDRSLGRGVEGVQRVRGWEDRMQEAGHSGAGGKELKEKGHSSVGGQEDLRRLGGLRSKDRGEERNGVIGRSINRSFKDIDGEGVRNKGVVRGGRTVREYDIWAMEMEHYLEYIDNEVWKVIQNGNSKKRISTRKDGIVRVLSPVTGAEIQAVDKRGNAKNILLKAISKRTFMRRFLNWMMPKRVWEAIRIGLEKGYDRFQQLLSQLEAHGVEVSTEDANHKFRRSLPSAWLMKYMKKMKSLKVIGGIGINACKEKEQLQKTIDSWKDSSKNLWRLIDSGMSSNSKVGLGFGNYKSTMEDHPLKNMVDRGIFDSGCSGHMTGYLYGKRRIQSLVDLDFDSVSFVKELGHFNLFSISQIYDKQHKVLFTETECLVVSSDFKMPDENQDYFKGKQHRASCKAKLERLITVPLHTLHMDLFGPTSVKSINHASYCLVITDDCTRFSWVFFLASKDETSGILQTFIRQIENQLSHRVKIIRSDNGTEFKNRDMLEFCGNKGIKQEYSTARTPQQNGVAEDMNSDPIEAARTMLADSLLPTTFWAEAVSTACYIFNRVLHHLWLSEEKAEEVVTYCLCLQL
ncbi:ribonuclease H-like domain-containing protein [Tanacetum coccineum]